MHQPALVSSHGRLIRRHYLVLDKEMEPRDADNASQSRIEIPRSSLILQPERRERERERERERK